MSLTLVFTDGDQAGPKSYGWANVCYLGSTRPRAAVMNAESVAYLSLANRLYSLGFDISKEGYVFSPFRGVPPI